MWSSTFLGATAKPSCTGRSAWQPASALRDDRLHLGERRAPAAAGRRGAIATASTSAPRAAATGIAHTVRPLCRRLKKWRTNAASSMIATSTSHACGRP